MWGDKKERESEEVRGKRRLKAREDKEEATKGKGIVRRG